MPIARKFFDWHEPALPQVVQWLCETYRDRNMVDLSDLLIVVPGRRAGRRLEDLLLERTKGRFNPPKITTLGELPEELYVAQRPFAGDLTQRLAWADALSRLPRASLEILLQTIPDEGDLDRWLALGTMLAQHHRDLAADALDFSHIAELGGGIQGFDEHDRWGVLRDAQRRYLQRLDGLNLWDKQTARLEAIRRRECHTDRQILLLAAVDINQAPRRMLDLVSDRVTALIHAPEDLADRFDEHGCLRPEAWAHAPIELAPRQVHVVDGPLEQAAEAAYIIAGYEGAYRGDQITIGVADEALIPHLRRQLGECGLAARPVVERTLPQTPPARLLAAVAEYLSDDTVTAFASLVRHPDLSAYVASQGLEAGWLSELDDYAVEHLQPRLGEWLGSSTAVRRLRPVFTAVRSLLAPLIAPPRPLGEWSQPIADLLVQVYGWIEFDEESNAQRMIVTACKTIEQTLQEHAEIPEELGATFTAVQAIALVLDAVEGESVPPLPDPQAIPMLGWLELPLDDAPAAVVTTFNEGFVPKSLNSDLFLPNELRRRLGVLDNSRRYARDAYALSVLLHSRETVSLIVGRRTAEGDPLKPSRLLFATEPETIARRVIEFFNPTTGHARPARPPLPSLLTTSRDRPDFVVPRPTPCDAPLDPLSVTAFRDYLACPYRYYLRRVLKLTSADDTAEELTGLHFGILMHDVLKEFGESPLIRSTEPDEIREFLQESLERWARTRHGTARRPTVQLQLEQLRQRLNAFAEVQAHNVDLGWETHHIEVAPGKEQGVAFDLGDGRSVRISGRIDRIDYHPDDDQWRIIDYKTQAKGQSPDQIHRKSSGWIDLQLPLYRFLAPAIDVIGKIQLAYFLLPDQTEQTRIEVAEWTPAELAEADELAREIARKILDQQFWPPAHDIRYDDWAAICHLDQFDGEALTVAPLAEEDD